jgi:hypothetical protein
MPRRRWRIKARREPLSPALRAYLELGLGGVMAARRRMPLEGYAEAVYFSHERERAAAWQEYGDEITADWVAAHPGERPWGWWQHVAPGPRLCLEGAKYVYRGAKPGDGNWIWQEDFGLPGRPQARRPGAAPARMLFESQATFLQRHDLLMPGEAERLTAEALAPEIVSIPEIPEFGRLNSLAPSEPARASTNGAGSTPSPSPNRRKGD